jgi:hypothetical protein
VLAGPRLGLPTPPWLAIVCLGVVWLYVWLWVEPPLRYHQTAPSFYLRADFFRAHLSRSGGLLDYAAAWLAQLDYRAKLGALVTTTLFGLAVGGAWLVLGRAGRFHPAVPFVPALALLLLASQYDVPWIAVGLGAVLALGTLAAWQSARPDRLSHRATVFWSATALLFYLAGPVSALMFVVLGCLWEVALARRSGGTTGVRPGSGAMDRSEPLPAEVGMRAAGVPAVAAIPRRPRDRGFGHAGETAGDPAEAGSGEARAERFGGVMICGLSVLVVAGGLFVSPRTSLMDLVSHWGHGLPLVAAAVLHLFLPLALCCSSASSEGTSDSDTESSARARSRGFSARAEQPGRTLRWEWCLAGVVLVAGTLALTSGGTRRSLLRIDWEAQQGRWEQVLEAAHRLRVWPGPATRLAITQALFQTGRLTDDLFAFAQRKDVDLLPSMRDGMPVCVPLSDTLLELGQANLAEHFAHEALENLGERPHLLWQLARINVLQNRPRAARVFLNRLRQIPFHGPRADHRLRALEADPTLSGEADIVRVRPRLVTTDYADSGVPTEVLLRQLLQSNRRNRMAFEYLMAHYLLTGQVEPLVQNLRLLDELGMWETPRHLEEAMLVHSPTSGDGKNDNAGRRVSADTARRYREFQARLSQNGGRSAGIELQLAREFGDTVWFYQLFGATFGGAPPVFNPTRP